MIKGVGHIGILVNDIEKTLGSLCQALDAACPPIKDVADRQMKVAVLELGGVSMEFIQDYSENGTFGKLAREKGNMIHHFALLTDDVEADLARLGEKGVERSGEPRIGLRGKKVVFLKPDLLGGIPIELTEP